MHTFEWIIGLLLAAVALSALARRLGVPYPVFLALGGAGLAFLPSSPEWALDPHLALALFVAPVLLDAAYDTSLRDLRDNWLAVATLVVVAVAVTTLAVALMARWLIPGMPWTAAIALGAIVAPPDAAAATTILKQVKLPHRLAKILEGESLLNDATALLILRAAVGISLAETTSVSSLAPEIVLALVGSIALGYALAIVLRRLMSRIEDRPSAIIVQFSTTFTVWIIAENLGLSGILTIVIYAFTVARTAPAQTPARIRVPAYAVWDTAVFLLNVMAFVLIGLQLRPILSKLPVDVRVEYFAFAGAVLLTIVLIRIIWVMTFNAAVRAHIARFGFHPRRPMMQPSVKGGLVISWCGMRGIVTLAAAFSLPDGSGGGAAFPYRDLILLTAFVVVLGSLLIQGLTLGPLIRLLNIEEHDPVIRETRLARRAAYRAALDAINDDSSDAAKLLRKEYQAMLDRSGREEDDGIPDSDLPGDPLRRHAIQAARDAVLKLRDTDEIGDDAFHRIEEELDWAEINAEGVG